MVRFIFLSTFCVALGPDKLQNGAVLGGGLVWSAEQTPHLGVWNASQSVRAMLEQWQLGLCQGPGSLKLLG